METPRQGKYPTYEYDVNEVSDLIRLVQAALLAYGGKLDDSDALSSDDPRRFTGDQLVRAVEACADLLGVSEHCETLIMRVKGLLADARMKPLVSDREEETLEGWLNDYVANDGSPNATI